ncbi:MAG: tetratricopeptide repeat protein [Acidobacteriota bacterium]
MTRKTSWKVAFLGAFVLGGTLLAADSPAPEGFKEEFDHLRGMLQHRDYSGVEKEFGPLLARAEKEFGADSLQVSNVLNVLVTARRRAGRTGVAGTRDLAERAVKIKEKAYGRDDPRVVFTLNGLASVDYANGAYLRAKPLYERVIHILESSPESNPIAVSKARNNFANVRKELGDLAGARRDYEQILNVREEHLDPDDPLIARVLNNLGVLLTTLGDHRDAREKLGRALVIREKAFDEDDPRVGESLHNLANVLAEIGETAEARRLYERAGRIYEESLGAKSIDLAANLTNLAYLLTDEGEYDAALPLYERALDIMIANGPDHPDVAYNLIHLAELHRKRAEPDLAEPLFRRALVIREHVYGPDHPEVAENLLGLALVLRQEGNLQEALEMALRAERIGREHVRLTARSLEERGALRYAAVRASGQDLILSLITDDPRLGERPDVLDAVVRSRAIILDEMGERNRILSDSSDPELARLVHTLEVARTMYSNVAVRGPDPEHPERYRTECEDALARRQRAEKQLAEKSSTFRKDLSRSTVSLDDVRAGLPAGSASVSFIRFDRLIADGERAKSADESVAWYMAFVLRSGEERPRVVALGNAARVEELVSHWGEAVRKGRPVGSGTAKAAEASYRAAGDDLRRAIWDPVSKHLERVRLVFVIPDGALNLVSLAALPVSGSAYLVETGPMVQLMSAERDLVTMGRGKATGRGLLALGAPAFDDTSPFSSVTTAPRRETAVSKTVSAVRSFRGARSACGGFQSLRFRHGTGSERSGWTVA